jgi:GNAT superfamily N-acetyltransferase
VSQIQSVSGDAIRDYIPALARLRIAVFAEYPYLYDGDLAYEKEYLRSYADTPDCVVVLAFDGSEIVGVSTAMPLVDYSTDVQMPFIQNDFDIDKIFYLGESVLLPAYRGQGIGLRFFEEREAHARKLNRFEIATFCAVEHPDNHPKRPVDYQSLNALWNRRGYFKHSELQTTFEWKQWDETEASPKPMVFWLKKL